MRVLCVEVKCSLTLPSPPVQGEGTDRVQGEGKITHGSGERMITLTRLNGQPFVINAEKIRYIESTPDTVVCCDTGEKMMVKETLLEVTKRAIEYARVIRRPVTD